MKTRQERTENRFRFDMSEALLEVLYIINPEDQITYRAMKYEDLVIYARDWLQTEVQEVTQQTSEPESLKLD